MSTVIDIKAMKEEIAMDTRTKALVVYTNHAKLLGPAPYTTNDMKTIVMLIDNIISIYNETSDVLALDEADNDMLKKLNITKDYFKYKLENPSPAFAV